VKALFAIFALVLAFAAQNVQAQAQGDQPKAKTKSLHEQFTGQGYGTAGCGLGSIVFGETPGLVQLFASTTNDFSGTQTFGITSGTSNCGASAKQARANQFIEVNKVALDNDLARGTGESISALQQVMGCKNPDFSTSLRKSYQPGATQEQMVQAADQSCQI